MKRHSVLLSMTVVAFFASADPGRAACQEQSANGFIVLGNGLIEVEIFLADTNGDGLPETYQCAGETPLTLIQGSNLLSCPNESFDFEVWVGDTTNDFPVFAGNVPVAFFGGPGNDEVAAGTPFKDYLHGGTDDDRLRGGDGDDHLCLWSGRRQRAYGGLGNDYLFGGPDRDRLYGGLPPGLGNPGLEYAIPLGLTSIFDSLLKVLTGTSKFLSRMGPALLGAILG